MDTDVVQSRSLINISITYVDAEKIQIIERWIIRLYCVKEYESTKMLRIA